MAKLQTKSTRPIYTATGFKKNHCVAIAWAMAFADDPDNVREVTTWAHAIKDELLKPECPGRFDHKGTYFGFVGNLVKHFGMGEVVRIAANPTGWSRRHDRRKLYPTVASWLRANPDVTEAIIRTTGHAGYYKDGTAYALGARARVDHVIVLARK